jgi:hypothetical protein
MSVAAFTGVQTSGAFDLDRTATATGSNTSPSSGNTGTTTTANELLFGAIGFEGAAGELFSPGSNYTLPWSQAVAGPCGTDNMPCDLGKGFPATCASSCTLDLLPPGGADPFVVLRRCTLAAGCTSNADYQTSVDPLPECLCGPGSQCSAQLWEGIYYWEGTGTFTIPQAGNGTCAKGVTFISNVARLTIDQRLYQTGRCYDGVLGLFVAGPCPVGTTYQIAGQTGSTASPALYFGNNIITTGLWLAPNGQAQLHGNSGNRTVNGGVFANTIYVDGNGWTLYAQGTSGAPGPPLFTLYQ